MKRLLCGSQSTIAGSHRIPFIVMFSVLGAVHDRLELHIRVHIPVMIAVRDLTAWQLPSLPEIGVFPGSRVFEFKSAMH